jgi:hypothetical protein
MSTKTRLQIPIDIQLKNAVLDRLRRLGFTSLTEIVRAFLVQFSEGKMTVGFIPEQIEMVDEETEKRIGESLDDYAHGRYVTVNPFDKEALKKALNQ